MSEMRLSVRLFVGAVGHRRAIVIICVSCVCVLATLHVVRLTKRHNAVCKVQRAGGDINGHWIGPGWFGRLMRSWGVYAFYDVVMCENNGNSGLSVRELAMAFPGIEMLGLRGMELMPQDAEALAGLRSLAVLGFDGCIVPYDCIRAVATSHGIGRLQFTGMDVTVELIGAIDSAAALKTLELWNCRLGDGAICECHRLENLRQLVFVGSTLSGTNLDALSGCHQVTDFVYWKSRLDCDDVRAIGRMRSLERLDLRHTAVDCQDIAPFLPAKCSVIWE